MNRTYLLVTLALLGTVVFMRACVARPGTNFSGLHFNRGANAIWLDITWAMDPHSSAEIAALVKGFEKRQIRTVFAYASYLKPNGRFNPTYSHAKDFVKTAKTLRPGLSIQAWIGLPLAGDGLPAGHGYVDLSDASTREKIVSFCGELVYQLGFDGVHLDPEPVASDDRDLLFLLEEIRGAIGPKATLSISTKRIRPLFPGVPLPLVGQMAWTTGYYREIAQRVDQMAVMVYDSGLPLPELYRQWGRFQVIELSRAVDGLSVQVFIGVPTSEEKTKSHWPSAENMATGLQGVIDGLNDAAARPSAITGVAIYPDWETDESEWATYEDLWLGRQ